MLPKSTNLLLIAAAVLPAVFLLIRVERADRLEKESPGLLLSLVAFGVLATSLAALGERLGSALLGLFLPAESLLYRLVMYFVVVGLSEEGAKYVLLRRRTWNHPEFDCQFDGVVYAVFVSLGFALWENIGYVAFYGLGTALVRAVTAVPGHACFGVFMGAFYGLAKRAEGAGDLRSASELRGFALLIPTLLHGFYDFAATSSSAWMGWAFLIFVVGMFIVASRLVKLMSKNDFYIARDRFRFFR